MQLSFYGNYHNINDVFLAALDSAGKLYVSKGIDEEEREGMHGME